MNASPADLLVTKGTLMVEELTDDLNFNGTITMYDPDSPYMFCRVVYSLSEDTHSVVVINRYNKMEFLSGYYFISENDIKCKFSENYYKSMVV